MLKQVLAQTVKAKVQPKVNQQSAASTSSASGTTDANTNDPNNNPQSSTSLGSSSMRVGNEVESDLAEVSSLLANSELRRLLGKKLGGMDVNEDDMLFSIEVNGVRRLMNRAELEAYISDENAKLKQAGIEGSAFVAPDDINSKDDDNIIEIQIIKHLVLEEEEEKKP